MRVLVRDPASAAASTIEPALVRRLRPRRRDLPPPGRLDVDPTPTGTPMTRPPAPATPELPADRWVAVEEDPRWTCEYDVVQDVRSRSGCRFIVNRKGCGLRVDAVLFRGRGPGRTRPFGYCSRHLYGRWLEAGKVMSWRVIR